MPEFSPRKIYAHALSAAMRGIDARGGRSYQWRSMRILFLLTCVTALVCAPLSSRADTLVSYPFYNGTLSPNAASGVTATGFLGGNGSDAVVGIGNGGNGANTGGGNYAYILITQTSTSASSAVSNDQYAQFSVTPPTGNGMYMTQIQVVAGRGGESTPRGLVLRWSFDNYGSNLATATVSQNWPSTGTYTFNLNAFAGSTVSFRVYAYATPTGNVGPSVRMKSLSVLGNFVYYAPYVTPASTFITTSHTNYNIKGTAGSSVGLAAVKVAKNNANGNYVIAKGTYNWTYKATKLKKGSNTFYVVSVDDRGTVSSPPVKVVVKYSKPKPTPTPTPTPTP
jgi:hypothetical protein